MFSSFSNGIILLFLTQDLLNASIKIYLYTDKNS